jgi:hypothetical protein
MPALDRSIFRERAIEKYMRRQEINVVLRLVSPRVSRFLWVLCLLFFAVGVLAWSIQTPVVASGHGIVIQQNANRVNQTVVLLLLPTNQLPNLHVGQSVNVTINAMSANFNSSIQNVEPMVMSPNDIRTKFNVPASLAPVITGPFAVAIANVVPASQASTYLGSESQVTVQVGSESVLSMLPGVGDTLNNVGNKITSSPVFSNLLNQINSLIKH